MFPKSGLAVWGWTTHMVPPHREKTWSNYSTGLWSWGVLFSILLSFMGPPMRNFWDKRSLPA